MEPTQTKTDLNAIIRARSTAAASDYFDTFKSFASLDQLSTLTGYTPGQISNAIGTFESRMRSASMRILTDKLMNSLYQNCLDGNIAAMRLYMEIVEGWSTRTDAKAEKQDPNFYKQPESPSLYSEPEIKYPRRTVDKPKLHSDFLTETITPQPAPAAVFPNNNVEQSAPIAEPLTEKIGIPESAETQERGSASADFNADTIAANKPGIPKKAEAKPLNRNIKHKPAFIFKTKSQPRNGSG
ncbi:MAG: hypothetical protein V4543_05785 [Bacteroidota bacterium]